MQQNPTHNVYPLNSERKLKYLLKSSLNYEEIAEAAGKYYSPFDRFKGLREDGSEKWRHIDNPIDPLHELQDKIYHNLLKPFAETLPMYMTGGMPFRSIIDNAAPHLVNEAVLGLDIVDCFPSIGHKRIFQVWREDLGCSEKIARMLTQLTTLHFHLPQGSPVSPILCNLALRPLAEDIYAYANANGLTFTIYVDDITLSGDKQAVRNAIGVLIPLVQKHGYQLGKDSDKMNIMDSNEIQKTTGLMVNGKLTVPTKKVDELFREIQRLGRLGDDAKTYELNSVWGKINFINGVDPRTATSLKVHADRHLSNINPISAAKPKDRTRRCKNYKGKH